MEIKSNDFKSIKNTKYRIVFAVLSLLSFASILVIHINGKPSWEVIRDGLLFHPSIMSVLGFTVLVLPFLISASMFALWAIQKRDLTGKDFVCRVAGVLLTYSIYLFWVWNFIDISTKLKYGLLFYPLTMPLIMPVVYGAGYMISKYIQKLLWNDKD